MSTSINAYKNIFDNLKNLFSFIPSSSNITVIRELCLTIKNDLAILYPSIFDNNKQQDAHEAFLKICEILDNATKSVLFTSSQPDPLGLDYDSIIKRLFFGIQKITETCSSCSYSTEKSESFFNMDISPSNNIQKTIISEWNRNSFQKTCQICDNTTQHLQTISIQVKPNILVILFKRFRFLKTGRLTKLNTEIALPEQLKIPGFFGNLIGFIDHLGTTPHSGHYVSNVKIDNTWFLCNDSLITPNTSNLNSSQVYIAFYKLTD